MTQVIETVDVHVPVQTAYNQWTQFEEFPNFMDGIEEVRQLDDTHLHWVAEIAGKRQEWDAEITEQRPDERVAWKSTSGDHNQAGVVTFHRLGDKETRITVQLDWEPSGVAEQAGSMIGMDDRQVRGDLERFKEMIESRGQETGPGAARSIARTRTPPKAQREGLRKGVPPFREPFAAFDANPSWLSPGCGLQRG